MTFSNGRVARGGAHATLRLTAQGGPSTGSGCSLDFARDVERRVEPRAKSRHERIRISAG